MFVEGFKHHASAHHLQDVSKVAYLRSKRSVVDATDILPIPEQPTHRQTAVKCGPPYKGILRYGEPVSIIHTQARVSSISCRCVCVYP